MQVGSEEVEDRRGKPILSRCAVRRSQQKPAIIPPDELDCVRSHADFADLRPEAERIKQPHRIGADVDRRTGNREGSCLLDHLRVHTGAY